DAAQQREAADGGDGAAEAHGWSITAIILSSLPAIFSPGGGRRCDGRYKPLPRPVPRGAGFLLVVARQPHQGLAILRCELLVVADNAFELVGRQHGFEVG